jgi:hypothetical protein
MSILVTTTRAFWCLDANAGVAYRIDDGNGAYYGISFDDERIFVAARRSAYGAGRDTAAERGVILQFAPDLSPCGELGVDFPLRDIHQICCFDRALWVVCTRDDLVAIHRDGEWERWYPLGAPPDAGTGHCHFNSILATDRHILIGGSIDRVGAIWAFDRDSRRPLRLWYLGYGSHNLWRDGGELYTMSSLAGEVVSLGGRRESLSRGNFVRGVAIAGGSLWYGVSARAPRHRRAYSDSMVVRRSRSDGARTCFNFRGFGMVHEIRVPGETDQAHPHSRGPRVAAASLAHRFSALDVGGDPVLREIPARAWAVRRLVQDLDRGFRRWRLGWRYRSDPSGATSVLP